MRALCGSEPGIDPYTRAVSDVYQDLFGEGSFIGKGIYEVDAFERTLNGRFPENRILSHDLLEGCYARAGLLSDVQLYEEYPSRYSADVSRRHRWIRGDWQIAAMAAAARSRPRCASSEESALGAVPMEDLRQPAAQPRARGIDTPVAAGLDGLAIGLVLDLVGARHHPDSFFDCLALWMCFGSRTMCCWASTSPPALRSAGRHFAQAAFTLACLPYEAFFSLDAIVRTNWRMLVTHKTAARMESVGQPGSQSPHRPRRCYRTMWIAPALAAAAAIVSGAVEAGRIGCGRAHTGPLVRLSRYRLVDQPAARPPRSKADGRPDHLSPEAFPQDLGVFREPSSARKIIGCRPTTFRSIPLPWSRIARRRPTWDWPCSQICPRTTSATFPPGQLIERTANALHTMEALERHRGHFYNWYDTQSLKPLPPLYISTVDSGNLAGHLLTLRPGLLALPDHKILGSRLFEGFSDTLRVLEDAAGRNRSGSHLLILQKSGVRLRFPASHACGGAAVP